MERPQNKGHLSQFYFKNSQKLRKTIDNKNVKKQKHLKPVKPAHFSIGRFYVESVQDTFKCLKRLNPSIAKEMLDNIHCNTVGEKKKSLINQEEAAVKIQAIFRGHLARSAYWSIMREIAQKEEEEQIKLDLIRTQQEESQMECQKIEMQLQEKLYAERQSDQLRNYSATLIQQAFRKSRSSQVAALQEPEDIDIQEEDDQEFEGEDTAATLALSYTEEQKQERVQEMKDPSLSYDSFQVTPLCSSQIKVSIFQSVDIPPKVISPVNSSQLFDLTSLRGDFEQIHRRAPSFNPPRDHRSNDSTSNKENQSMQQKKEAKSIENVINFQKRLKNIHTQENQQLINLKAEADELIILIKQKARELEGLLHEQRSLKKKITFSEEMLNFLLVRSTKSPKKKR